MILLALLAVSASAVAPAPLAVQSITYPDVYDYSHAGWEDYGSPITLTGPLAMLKITCEWNDQGWGYQKGHMRVILMRGAGSGAGTDMMVNQENLFGVAPHTRTAVSYVRYKHNYPIMNETMAGDYLQLQYHVGGGGGHRLSVYGLVVEYSLLPNLPPGQTMWPTPSPTGMPSVSPTPAPTKNCAPNMNDWGCCTSSNKCAAGEGDCDYDGDCVAGTFCMHDVGTKHGVSYSFDVCMAVGTTHTPTNSPTAPDCRAMLNKAGCCASVWSYKCKEGEGECNSDYDCEAGLYCTADAGAIFGGAPSLDVCTKITRPPTSSPTGAVCTPSNSDWSCCSYSNKCASGGGDCDSDSDCEGNLMCIDDVGQHFGASSSFDICLAPGEACQPRFNDNSCCGQRLNNMGRRLYGGGWGYGCGYGSSYYGGGGGYGSKYECHEGEGGCNSDRDCATGLSCEYGQARKYGSTMSYMGVCVIPAGQNGRCDPKLREWGCCTDDYPCEHGGGDCDYDDHCAGSMTCSHDVGRSYGVSYSFDVCEAAPTAFPTTAPTVMPTQAPTSSPTVDCLSYSMKDCKKDATAKLYCKKVKGKCFFKNVVDCTMYNLLGSKGKKSCDKDKILNCAWDKSSGTCGKFQCANFGGRNSKNCDPYSPQCAYDAATKTCNDNTDCSVAVSKRECSSMVSLGLNAYCVWQNNLCEDVTPPTTMPTPSPVQQTIVCTTVTVGNNTPYSNAKPKKVNVPGLQSWQTCPTDVNLNNWLGTDTYPDEFTVVQKGSKVVVTRINANHTGWGMNLVFQCCGPQPGSVATPSPTKAKVTGCAANTGKTACKNAGCKWKGTYCK